MNVYERALFLDAITPLQVRTVLAFGYAVTLAHPQWTVTVARPDMPPPKGERYDMVFLDGLWEYRSLKTAYERIVPLADKVVGIHHIVGMRGYPAVGRFWAEIAYAPRLDIGGEDALKDGFFEAIEGSDRCSGIGWWYV